MRRNLDVGRLSKAVQRPGVDPRVWCCLATVQELGIDAQGVFADVQVQPDGNVETCYVGTPFAGSVDGQTGYGDWCPLEVGDTVLVAIPMGDSDSGPIIVTRVWNAGDPPPAQLQEGEEPPADRWIIARPKQSIQLLATLMGKLADGGTAVTLSPDALAVVCQTMEGLAKSALDVSPDALTASVKAAGVGMTLSLMPTAAKLGADAAFVQVTPASVELTAPSVTLGSSAGTPLAHAIEVTAALTAIATALESAAAAIDGVVSGGGGGTPATNANLQAYFSGAFHAASATINTQLATLATLLTKAT